MHTHRICMMRPAHRNRNMRMTWKEKSKRKADSQYTCVRRPLDSIMTLVQAARTRHMSEGSR